MKREEALQWWREAKLGLFIHWGIYSIPAQGEWIMYTKRIPVGEYEKLAPQFNPADFNASDWVRFAKENGMKYIVITAKHHDGFSMLRTKVSRYNIMEATPFGRDSMAELAEACQKEGIKLGFYYSHVREWHHPMANSFEKKGRGDLYGNYGNFWDYTNENLKNLQTYIDEFDMPQIKELLTQYGDILTIWFDTPSQISPEQGRQIRQLVYEMQEGCLVNSRLSEDIEVDYLTMPDDGIPASGLDCAWETPMTTHDGWGYVENAHYQPSGYILRKIAEVAGKGGNLLLNVGPDSRGRIPEGAVKEFREIGRWLDKNGEAVYGTQAAGLPYLPEWGYVTRKEKELYLIVTDSAAERLSLAGVESPVGECVSLETKEPLEYKQCAEMLEIDIHDLRGDIRVVKLLFAEQIVIKKGLYPGDSGAIELPASLAELRKEYCYSKMEIKYGVTEQWIDVHDSLAWKFENTQDVKYRVQVMWDSKGFWGIEDFGHELEIRIGGVVLNCCVSDEIPAVDGTRRIYAGCIRLPKGSHRLELVPKHIVMKQLMGLRISGVRLERDQEIFSDNKDYEKGGRYDV